MLNQSKILVLYEVSSQKVVLGEVLSAGRADALSMWRAAPEERGPLNIPGFRLSLFDADGREIAGKAVSMLTADAFLGGLRNAS
ncbi:30S ribosomal protein S6 modification protein [Vibrio sonorensis]|uniref:30S ribosomal protein S6 modification protein n=1 Tax=Vibrio sonorensis TaxID=1004316 RepID=UPI0008DA8BF7|nr:30S ribosomal protein S6 modification protein [Vibrio sonorensis]